VNSLTNRRQEILEKARKFFSEKSFHAVSLEDITRSLGMGKSTMYHYFPTKKDLITEVLKESASELYKRVNNHIDRSKPIKDQIKSLISAILYYYEENEEAFLLIYRERLDFLNLGEIKDQFDANFKTEYDQFFDHFYAMVEQGKKEGYLLDVDSSVILANIFGTINVLTLRAISRHSKVKLTDMIDDCCKVIMHGICL
jgi:AcrR family transcriptional regulator